jgi:hypothetical protein
MNCNSYKGIRTEDISVLVNQLNAIDKELELIIEPLQRVTIKK